MQGMNQRLLPWLQQRKGKRFGIISKFRQILNPINSLIVIVFDFYDAVPELVEAAIGL